MRAAGPVVDPIPCSGCGKIIDPLRAGHVAIFDQKFHFFCARVPCRARFLGEPEVEEEPAIEAGDPPPPDAQRPRLARSIVPAFEPMPDVEPPAPPPLDDDPALIEPFARPILHRDPAHEGAHEPRDIGALLLVIAVVAGALAVALGLAGDTRLVVLARVTLAGVGAGMLIGRALTTPSEASEPHPAPPLLAPVAVLAVAIWAAIGRDAALAAEAASLSGILVTAAAVGGALTSIARRDVSAERSFIAAQLAAPGRRVTSDGAEDEVFDLKPGEGVEVEPGEVVPVDLTITGGDVDVLPWLGASTPRRRRAGDPVIAGAEVTRGKLTGNVVWTGNDRAFARVLIDPRRRADVLAPLPRAGRALTERWAFAAAAIAAISAVIARRSPIEIAMIALAVHASIAASVIASIAGVHAARGVLFALRRGIAYKNADAWDRAGKVTAAVFAARGTLLLGEPDIAELESPGERVDPLEVLALAAGAERSEEHPIATAIVRAAYARKVKPDGVRNPNTFPGLGVTAVSSSGEELCVGSRALMLEQRISIAVAEERITELEALGRTVVLVALGARLVGLIGLADGLRPGARAAVQHLFDAQIEPVLLSGDARDTCEAIARSLDIEHIRPEVLPSARGAEVRRLVDAGENVAVIGHGGVDDAALAAANVGVALGAAGTAPDEHAVTLASDDVRDAALALALARKARIEARLGLFLAAAPALLGSVIVTFGLLPPAYAPLAGLLGAAVSVAHARRGHAA